MPKLLSKVSKFQMTHSGEKHMYLRVKRNRLYTVMMRLTGKNSCNSKPDLEVLKVQGFEGRIQSHHCV